MKKTDQDDKLYDAFETLCGPDGIYPNCEHSLCVFHKLNRNLTQHSNWESKLDKLEDNDMSAYIEFCSMVGWLWS